MNLALIPARAGSKGIPNKSLFNGPVFRGATLINHTIEAAVEAKSIDATVISTNDDATIDHYARSMYPVQMHKRSEYLASDLSPTEETIREIMRIYNPDICVLLQLTSPLRTAQHVDEAVELLLDTGSDAVVSVSPFHGFLWHEVGDMAIAQYDPRHRPQRQAQETWKENGAIYAFTKKCWDGYGARWGGKVALYKMSQEHAIEIDEPYDLALAEAASVWMER